VRATAVSMGLDEEKVGWLLEVNGLRVRREEAAFEGLVGWMKGSKGRARRGPAGRNLMGNICFGMMAQDYLGAGLTRVLS
jgi:hypothetical protein